MMRKHLFHLITIISFQINAQNVRAFMKNLNAHPFAPLIVVCLIRIMQNQKKSYYQKKNCCMLSHPNL